jgi:cytochrome c peroxidase
VFSDLFDARKARPSSSIFEDQLDHQMHDLHLERFLKEEPGDGPIKTFTLRGIKDSPPYLHDGRALTLEDTVEFFNLVMQLRLTPAEKRDLVAFMRQL